MPRGVSRNDPCPCGSGKKYKKCCINKGFQFLETEDGDIVRSIPLSAEAMDVFEDLKRAQIEKYGYLPERVFEGAPPAELIEHWTVEAMKKGGVEPALIYAYEKTNGLLLNEQNERMATNSDVAEWDAAVDEYERTSGQQATRRRLNDRDLQAILENGPGREPQPDFVTELPFPPPFPKERWEGASLSSLIEVPEFFAYFQRCLADITESGRGENYVRVFSMLAALPSQKSKQVDYDRLAEQAMDRNFTTKEIRNALESLFSMCQPEGALPNAVAAFELTAFIGSFVREYADEAGLGKQLDESLVKVDSMAFLAFATAVNVWFGLQLDAWKTKELHSD